VDVESDVDIELVELPPPAYQYSIPTARPHPASKASLRRRAKVCQLLEDDMKFSHSIQFNAVPDWSSHYISYSNLKKLIYQLEQEVHAKSGRARSNSVADPESSPLLPNGDNVEDPDKIFSRKLDDELEKISSFYRLKELEIYGEVDALLKDVEEFESEHAEGEIEGEGGGMRRQSIWARARQQSIFRSFQFKRRRTSTMGSSHEGTIPEEDESGDDEDEHTALNKSQSIDRRPTTRGRDFASGAQIGVNDDVNTSQELARRRPSVAFNDFGDDALQALYDEGITLKKRVISLYVNICELRSFIQLNETGFSKVLKKYDKILDRKLKSKYINANVKPAYPFQSSTMDHLNENLNRVESAYASIVTKGDVEAARQELRLHLREHVVWERNTVWREMIGIERKAQAANLGIRNTMLGQETDPRKSRLQGDDAAGATKEIQTPLGSTRCPKFLLSGTFWVLVADIAVFAVLLAVPIMDKPEQQNCLALVVFVSLLWATEVRMFNTALKKKILILWQAIPLFVTSLLVPFLVVLLQVVRQDEKPHQRLSSKQATSYIFSAMWTPVIMLLLGGFTIAAALSKYNIAKMMATFVLSKAGTKPRTVLLTSMGVAMFASMWISNVAAPVLCFSIIQVIYLV
jgi:phosphate transporter